MNPNTSQPESKPKKKKRVRRFVGWAKTRRNWQVEYQETGCIPAAAVYNDMPAIPIGTGENVPTVIRRQADKIYAELEKAGLCNNWKKAAKQKFLHALVQAANLAVYQKGCVMISRGCKTKNTTIRLQVIDACVKLGYFVEYRSPRGSPKMSRLLATKKMTKRTSTNPWMFEPNEEKQFVFLRKRGTTEEIPFDREEEIPARVQTVLEQLNDLNNKFRITYSLRDEWTGQLEKRRLRPIHYALFTNNFQQHGRIYTGKYG